ncbi:TPA: C40 family peptidase [Klebsiella quasipneumoniae subsp. similipneumoniae]|nr:C40 family peptidase [Klebsiella quasipneumoniae subsp. similipneumoniae]
MSSDKKETVCSDIDVYSVLEHRARFVRRTNIALIILLIMAATLVATLIVGYKDNQKNWISDILNASIIKKNNLKPGDLVLFNTGKNEGERHVGVFLGNDFKPLSPEQEASYKAWRGITYNTTKNQSEKIADSIATVLLTLSLIIFVGFIMRAVLVFIRYYMQLGTDFENQRLAYIISKKEGGDFSKTLQDLRSSNINFEKTPQLPQEKIIIGLIDVLKNIAPSNKNSATKD